MHAWRLLKALLRSHSLSVAMWLTISAPVLSQERLPHVYSGSCTMDETEPDNKLPILCLRPELTASYLSDTSSSQTRFEYLGWQAYAGLHLLPYLSFHFQDNYNQTLAPRLDLRTVYHHDEREYYVTLGQITTSKPRLHFGHFSMPFGLMDDFRPRIFELQYSSGLLHERPSDTAQFTYDNLVNVRIDVAAGKDNERDLQALNQGELHKYSLRAAYDFSAMEGTRMLFSYFRDEHQLTSKIGAALYNNRQDSDGEGFLEWVRISNNWRKPFVLQAQMISAGFRQTMRKTGRSIARYEYLQNIHRMFDFGYEYELMEFVVVSGFVSLEKKSDPDVKILNTILTASILIRL